MSNSNELTKRKHPRLKEYDYSAPGRYFVTICTKDKMRLLSEINVGRGFAPAEMHLTEVGKIVESELSALPKRYPELSIEKYVIMPNHIHLIMSIVENTVGAETHPTLMDMICSLKSLTSHRYKALGFAYGLWQTSFYEHIIRSERDYLEIWTYIENNPARWSEDEYY